MANQVAGSTHPINFENLFYFEPKIIGISAPPWYCYDYLYPAQRSIVWPHSSPYPDEAPDDGTMTLTDERGLGPLVSVEMFE